MLAAARCSSALSAYGAPAARACGPKPSRAGDDDDDDDDKDDDDEDDAEAEDEDNDDKADVGRTTL